MEDVVQRLPKRLMELHRTRADYRAALERHGLINANDDAIGILDSMRHLATVTTPMGRIEGVDLRWGFGGRRQDGMHEVDAVRDNEHGFQRSEDGVHSKSRSHEGKPRRRGAHTHQHHTWALPESRTGNSQWHPEQRQGGPSPPYGNEEHAVVVQEHAYPHRMRVSMAPAIHATEKKTLRSVVPFKRTGSRVRSWAVGMTTAPRRVPTLGRSLRSLMDAGWGKPRIFAEPGSVIPKEYASLPMTQRDQTLGCWPSYYLALHELLVRQPKADAYMIAQDDVLFCTGDSEQTLREYLEEALWPHEDVGAVSLYTSLAYATDEPGWHALDRAWVWGACAFIFPRASLVHFLSHEAIQWRLTGRANGMRNIDVVVGLWQTAHGKSVWYPSTSLCQHIGDASTLWKNSRASGKRRARDFAGDMVRTDLTQSR